MNSKSKSRNRECTSATCDTVKQPVRSSSRFTQKMPNDPQPRNPVECSPRKLARKIESCIFRNALDEEQRAQKALYLLQARDRRIAFLEKRVTELEDVAANLHEFTLRNSSKALIIRRDKEVRDFPRSEKSSTSGNDDESNRKNDRDSSNIDSTQENLTEKWRENCDTTADSRMSLPRLKLSKSSASISERDIFTTAIDFVLEKRKCFTSNTSFSNEEDTPGNVTARDEKSNEETVNCVSETEIETADNRKVIDTEKDDAEADLEEEQVDEKENIALNEVICESKTDKRNHSAASTGNSKEKIRNRQQRSNFARISSSVPWIRARRSFRKKLRSFELKNGKRTTGFPAGDGNLTFTAFGPIERGSTDRRQGEGEMIDAAKKIENALDQKQRSSSDAQETRLIADKNTNETKTICTQTSMEAVHLNENSAQDSKASVNVNHFASSFIYLEQKKSSAFWSIDEDPAPQWLIEEALNRGTEVCKDEHQTKGKLSSNTEAEYEIIIAELETKLARAQEHLEEALRAKSMAKEKYKKSLENLKTEARKESEVLQERIVRICTSVLENFGPRSMHYTRNNSYPIKSHRKLKCHQRILNKLHKKLRMTVANANKLKRELASARRTLKSKSEENESISKCFDQLKQEMDATETKLNNLISENVALRQKMVDTRDWLQNTMGKEHHADHFRDVHKSRELTNLKKKVEEDLATIAQLRNKLVRSESANANKGFLLNSYKSQLSDFDKEKDQLVSKINSLENEIGNVRNNNSQLKAKISILNCEKNKLLSDKEKSKTDITEKVETKLAKKCEETVQVETDAIKAKYEELIKSMKMKLMVIKNQNIEYSSAIKEFLKKLYEYQLEYEFQISSNESEASEKEAQKTACHILNMTPEELSGFISGKSKNSTNPWLVELNRITAFDHFSKNLSKFLLKKATKKKAKT